MKQQNVQNYLRFYTPHHFVFYPFVGIMTALCVYLSFRYREQHFEWVAIAVAFLLIACLSFMMRQHYALTLQNRIVRLEMSVRYYQLTSKRLEDVAPELTFGQIASLRFASDKELENLVQTTIDEKLSPTEIRNAIGSWKADNQRV